MTREEYNTPIVREALKFYFYVKEKVLTDLKSGFLFEGITHVTDCLTDKNYDELRLKGLGSRLTYTQVLNDRTFLNESNTSSMWVNGIRWNQKESNSDRQVFDVKIHIHPNWCWNDFEIELQLSMNGRFNKRYRRLFWKWVKY